jgi:DNA-binding Lrp family transcriptional regulator
MKGGIFMNKNEQVCLEVLQDFREGRKTRRQAAQLLGISERAVSRRTRKLRELGIEGIKHQNHGRQPLNKLPETIKTQILNLVKATYPDFNIRHLHEKLRDDHAIHVSYTTLLKWCRREGLVRRKRRRPSKARIHRERMANEGILLQMDGSEDKWNGRDVWHLISMIDDATSNVPVGQFYDGETSWSCMHLLRLLFETRGVPQFLYTDGAGWAGGGGKRQNFSQVVRACEQLGIKIIRASSPQAKGRIERSFRTIQDRLIPEMRLKNIKTMRDANRYLQQVFWPDWNRRFTVEPREEISRYRPLRASENLREILCMQFDRQVNSDHTISFENERYRILPGDLGSLRRKTVKIHEYEDKRFQIFYGGVPLSHERIEVPKRKWI